MASPIVIRPRMRLILDNDYSGDPDGLFQLAHHLLSPSVEIRGVIGSHLRPGDPFDPSDHTADNARRRADEVVEALGMTGAVTTVAGSNASIGSARVPSRADAVSLLVDEAMRDDTELPLVVACGAGLTEIASALLVEPRIASRLTVVWIGGEEYPDAAAAPPGASGVEYNLNIDIEAARVLFNDSDVALWQVPRDAYRQTLMSNAELEARVRPRGAIGELLAASIADVVKRTASHGLNLGETYVYGDSPLVLLTALQSSFEADPSSSRYELRGAPTIAPDGRADFEHPGRIIRVYSQLDNRLMFEDLFAKLLAF